MRNVEG